MWKSQSFQQSLPSPLFPMSESVDEQKQNLSHLYQTPTKQNPLIANYNLSSRSPFQFDFNYYFGNLFTSGHLPNPQYESLSSTHHKRETCVNIFKSPFDKSGFRITPGSEYKISTHNQRNNSNSIENKESQGTERIYLIAKKNLSQVFDKANNVNFCAMKGKKEIISGGVGGKDVHENDFLFGSPPQKQKNKKKIFECSGSTFFGSSALKSTTKKKRFRKNNEQIKRLNVFYSENKHWTKSQIKKISEETGLKENKVYKWLWDQKNKEYKNAKFVINK